MRERACAAARKAIGVKFTLFIEKPLPQRERLNIWVKMRKGQTFGTSLTDTFSGNAHHACLKRGPSTGANQAGLLGLIYDSQVETQDA